jgi:ABC-type multidrug transport system fused ATPase/permease subunit
LKIILDNVVGSRKLAPWLDDFLLPVFSGGSKTQIAAAAAIVVVIIAVVGAAASYIANYYTTSVGQWVANDLRLRTYHHLHAKMLLADHARAIVAGSRDATDEGHSATTLARNGFSYATAPKHGCRDVFTVAQRHD